MSELGNILLIFDNVFFVFIQTNKRSNIKLTIWRDGIWEILSYFLPEIANKFIILVELFSEKRNAHIWEMLKRRVEKIADTFSVNFRIQAIIIIIIIIFQINIVQQIGSAEFEKSNAETS